MKKRQPNPAFGDRKKRQRTLVYSCIKTGLARLCRDHAMLLLLQECVSRASIIAVEASLLTSIHITRMLEEGFVLPVMDHTFFNQCVSSIANGKDIKESKNGPLHESLQLFRTLQPADYNPIGRLNGMNQILVMIAQQAQVSCSIKFLFSFSHHFCIFYPNSYHLDMFNSILTPLCFIQQNFSVSTELTLKSRLARWFRLRIKQHSKDYFEVNESHIIKSLLSVMTRASTEEPYSVAGLINAYKRFVTYA